MKYILMLILSIIVPSSAIEITALIIVEPGQQWYCNEIARAFAKQSIPINALYFYTKETEVSISEITPFPIIALQGNLSHIIEKIDGDIIIIQEAVYLPHIQKVETIQKIFATDRIDFLADSSIDILHEFPNLSLDAWKKLPIQSKIDPQWINNCAFQKKTCATLIAKTSKETMLQPESITVLLKKGRICAHMECPLSVKRMHKPTVYHEKRR